MSREAGIFRKLFPFIKMVVYPFTLNKSFFSGVTQEEIDDKRIETEKQMLEDLQKCVAEGRDIDREFRDQNGATPVRNSL